MNSDLLRRGDSEGKFVDELKEEQRSSKESIPPADLPFNLTAELGEILYAELKRPGVYFLSNSEREVYVVTGDAPAISKEAWSYGQEFPGHPDLRVYELYQEGSGWHIIDFEVRRHQMKCHLPIEDSKDSLLTIALYGMEEHPDYFGTYPVPIYTPRGCTVRHRTLLNGVYWLETDRCEEMLAVCYPVWQSDISIPEQNLAEQLEYDRMRGIDNTLGYLFFPKRSSVIPLYELSLLNPEIEKGGMVDMTALLNAICESYPEYTTAHNAESEKFKRSDFIKETPGAGTKFIGF